MTMSTRKTPITTDKVSGIGARPNDFCFQDGTHISDLIDVEAREVSLRVLSDPEIYRRELQMIFARSWMVIAHESEIPRRGDFVTRYVGEDKVIVSRTSNDKVSVILNVCTHRGAELCWTDRGRALSFTCPYHGWVFTGEGDFVGAPFKDQVYGDIDRSRLALTRARVEVRWGLIFVNFDPDAEQLDSYLGEMGWYLNEIFASGEFEFMGSPRRLINGANWKVGAEQIVGDMYHFATTHRPMAELGFLKPKGDDDAEAWQVAGDRAILQHGHGLMASGRVMQDAFNSSDAGKSFFAGRLWVGMIFPCTTIGTTPSPNPEYLLPYFSSMVPRGPNQFEMSRLTLVPKGMNEAARRGLRQAAAAGLAITPDDNECWMSMKRASTGHLGQQEKLRYNAVGAGSPTSRPEDWPTPAEARTGFHDDDVQWGFWLQWLKAMTA